MKRAHALGSQGSTWARRTMLGNKVQPQRMTSVNPLAGRGKGGFRHLVGRRQFVYCVINGRTRWIGAHELPAVLESFSDPDDLVAWCPQGLRYGATHRKENVERVYYLVIDLDNTPLPAEDLVTELHRRGFPEPWVVLETPHGAHLYWRLAHPLYLGIRPGEALEESHRRRCEAIRFFERTSQAVIEALQDVGADAQAGDVGHLFRLNAVVPIYLGHTKTSLAELLAAARAYLRRRGRHRPRLRPQRPRPVPTSEQVKSVWESPGIRWIREHIVPEGYRNAAVTALSIALFHDGHTEAEVRAIVSGWTATNTAPRYSQRELRDSVRSLARRWARGEPLGLDPEKLCAIHDIRGQTMPRELAEATKTALVAKTGARTQKPQRKPLAQRRKLPRIAWLPSLLRDESHRIPRTTRQRLAAVERYLNHLRQLAKSNQFLMPLGRREFLMTTVKAGLWPSEKHSVRSLAFWARREPGLWNSLLLAARDFLCALCGHRGRLAAPCTEPSERANRGFGPMGSGISADRGPGRGSGLETGLVCLADLCKMNHGGER